MYNVKSFVDMRKEALASRYKDSEQRPCLAIIQVGNDLASDVYISGKVSDCTKLSYNVKVVKLSEKVSRSTLTTKISELNRDLSVNGIILQLPVPKHLESCKQLITPCKDVDGFHPVSRFKPCTPLGIMNFLEHEKVDLDGKDVVIIGRSDLVGKPLAEMMIDKNATVTLCHSHTKHLTEKVKRADIIVSAVGKENLITKYMLSHSHQIGIDVGINRNADGKLCGDFSKYCYDFLQYITPVPGGVGLLTRLTLLENLCTAFDEQKGGE